MVNKREGARREGLEQSQRRRERTEQSRSKRVEFEIEERKLQQQKFKIKS